ncbi:MAG: hypothetical protein Q9201_007311 [Fulgogasparrea decipioides]
MDNDTSQTPDSDPAVDARQVLLAASNHDLDTLRDLLRTYPASVQDPETGSTPLHAAIAGADPSRKAQDARNGEHVNGEVDEKQSPADAAVEIVKLLLQNGAIWNDLDGNDETPGCLALRLGLPDLYTIMVDAGVRAEILISRLDEYEQLKDQDSDEEPEDEVSATAAEDDTTQVESTENVTAPEMIIRPPSREDAPQPNQPTYLTTPLSFRADRILDASANSVMMSWESHLMSLTASLLAPTHGSRILNIGHGMGIIDSHFQSLSPKTHHIVEAHPDVLTRMREEGWHEKEGVVVHEGRWQDILPKLLESEEEGESVMFDAIYFDTFAEPYTSLRHFFENFVIGLLADDGKWGFFNGMGADRQICYDVYTKVVELDLFEAGWDVEWTTVPVEDLEERGEWEGVRRAYWKVGEYRLPVCRFMG